MKTKTTLRWVIGLLAATTISLSAAPRPPKAKPKAKPTATHPSAQPAPTPDVIPKNVSKFTVKTPSASNPEVTFYVRVPANYSRTTPNRVLVLCPDDGISGLTCVVTSTFRDLADERGWFLISATLKQNAGAAPEDSYYNPAGFSGKAMFDALDWLSQKYPIAKEEILLQGSGGGAQFAQRFALLNPDKVKAVALNSANGFARPDAKAAQISWLVTHITTDTTTSDSAAFAAQLSRIGAKPVVRSYGEMAKTVPGQVDSDEVATLDRQFMKFHDDALRAKLAPLLTNPPAQPSPAAATAAAATETFIGDLRSLRYYKEGTTEAGGIPEESRVVLPCKALANAWGVQIEKFIVKTASPLNPEVPFYVRVPANYSPTTRTRVLFRCPVYNGAGIRCVSGEGHFQQLADERGWFVIAPTFKQDKADTKNRLKSYYYPETFSGPATLEALDLIARKYPIATDCLLMQGMSGGAQFVHRFAIWAPERVTAIAVNSASWFDVPNGKSAQVAWLITIGESDKSYENSLNFFDQLSRAGALPIFRSYIGMVHEGSTKVDEFDLLFLKFYDDATKAKLTGKASSRSLGPLIPAKAMPFIGDMKDWSFAKNEVKAFMRIAEGNRVYLPTREIARYWTGKGAEEDGGKQTGLNGAPY